MSKLILISGTGKGKTLIGNAMAEFYASRGIAHKRISADSAAHLRRVASELKDFAGFIVVDTNLPAEMFADLQVWQRIDIQGAAVLKQSDFSEMATEGFGSSSVGLYGIRQ
jgi:hypothetical protein